MKSERVILVGHGASGKDYLAKELVKKGLIKSTSYTSRPQRSDEVNGEVYHFVSVDEFKEMISNDIFYEFELFEDDWYYGSTNEDWETCNLFIKTVGGVSQIKEEDRDNCFVVFLDIPEEVRYKRLLERSDNDADRRIKTDRDDFKEFSDYDLRITDEHFDPQMVYDLMD